MSNGKDHIMKKNKIEKGIGDANGRAWNTGGSERPYWECEFEQTWSWWWSEPWGCLTIGVVGRGKGRCKGLELGMCLEHSRKRKTIGLLEPGREGKELQGMQPKRKQRRQIGQGLVSFLLSDLGKHGKFWIGKFRVWLRVTLGALWRLKGM